MLTFTYFMNVLSTYRTHAICNNQTALEIKSVQLYTDSVRILNSHILYIVDNSRIENNMLANALPLNLVLLHNHKISDSDLQRYSALHHNVILVENESKVDILNACLLVLSEYQQVQNNILEIYHVAKTSTSLQPILNAAYGILENPFFVRDQYFKILGHTNSPDVDDFIWNTQINGKSYQPYETFKYLERNGLITRTENTHIPVYFKAETEHDNTSDELITLSINPRKQYHLRTYFDPNSKTYHPRLYDNIFIKNRIIGQVVVIEAFRSFNEYDILYIEALSEAIAQHIQTNWERFHVESSFIDAIIKDLLNTNTRDTSAVLEKLKFVDQDTRGQKYVFALSHPSNKITNVTLNYFKGFFSEVFTTLSCILVDNHIVSIVRAKKQLPDVALQTLDSFLSDSKALCGISKPFEQFSDLKKHYSQSLAALRACAHTQGNYSFYSESVLLHIIDICDRYAVLKDLCHPALLGLIDYDQTYDTDYVALLKAYISALKSNSTLISEMHLHRNTLYYRLKKIEEITACDLNDADTFFSLYLSFKILEYTGELTYSEDLK